MREDYDEIIHGQKFKVISNDSIRGKLTVQSQNGSISQIEGLSGNLPERGAVIFVSENYWEQLPLDAWLTQNSVAIVKELLEDSRVIVECDYAIKIVQNPQKLQIQPNNTIEFNEIDGIVGLISEKPIRSRVHPTDSEDSSDAYLYEKSTEGHSFEDFGGYHDVVSRTREMIRNQLENRQYLDEMKVRPIRGLLLTGPPGTGKTFLARIIAQESDAKFFLVNGPTVVSKWLGETENTLREIFNAAKRSENGAIIFFDEIDSIAADRSGDTHEASKKLVAQLLTLMDGFDGDDGNVVVIAATNRAESLDPAIRRPGRFDWEIEFGIPTLRDRDEILTKSIERHTTASGLPVAKIVALTEGWSAAELVLIIAEAGQIAASDKRSVISAEDFAQGYERVAARLANNHRGRADA